jgi:hypothetical protein
MKKGLLSILIAAMVLGAEAQKTPCTTDPVYRQFDFWIGQDTIAIRRLTFYNLDVNKVRQFAEITKDNGATWSTEYDLEYRRKK